MNVIRSRKIIMAASTSFCFLLFVYIMSTRQFGVDSMPGIPKRLECWYEYVNIQVLHGQITLSIFICMYITFKDLIKCWMAKEIPHSIDRPPYFVFSIAKKPDASHNLLIYSHHFVCCLTCWLVYCYQLINSIMVYLVAK